LSLTGKQRSYLRGLAHHINPNINIGKHGLTNSSLKFIEKLLNDHELIKVKMNSGKKDDYVSIIEKKTKSFIVGSIGKVLIFYRNSKDKENKIKLP